MSSRRYRIQLTELSLQDLEDLLDYHIGQGSEASGRKTVATLRKAVDPLDKHPELGREVPEFPGQHIRELIRPPYRIVYLIKGEKIFILRFWRSQRNIKGQPFILANRREL